MNIRYVNEALTIDCTQTNHDFAATVLRFYLHRYLCSVAAYIYSGTDMRYTTESGAEIEVPANHEMWLERMVLRVDDASMEIHQAEEILKLLSFSGLMYGAEQITYEATFRYNDRSAIFRFLSTDPVEDEFVPAEAYFRTLLKDEKINPILSFRSVVEEDDPSIRMIVSLGKEDTVPRYGDEAFAQDVTIAQKVSAWCGSWITVGIHFPENTEQDQANRILNGLRELCSVYGDVDADDHIDTYEGEYDIGFTTALSFDATQQNDVFERLHALVELTNAAGGSATFDGDLTAKEDPFVLCRIQTNENGELSIAYAIL